jgi:hypothetical protein
MVNNELPMRDPHQLDNKEYLAMAEILEIQRKAEQLFGIDWYVPTCYASEIPVPIMKYCPQMM